MTPMVLNAMDSTLEALAFDYLNFGLLPLVNNVWTWIAVVAAAISFWRLKAVAVSPPNFVPPTVPSPPPPPAPLQDEKILEGGSETHACEPTPAPLPVVDNLVAGTMKKQKITFLYYEEVEEAEEVEEEEEEEEEGVVEEWWKRWEEALGTKRGEKGWYRYQRVGGLNGNVVRLWDGNEQRAS